MQLGMLGLGRMGSNMVQRLTRGGHECVVYDLNPASVETMVACQSLLPSDVSCGAVLRLQVIAHVFPRPEATR
jgi:6-phosphogluconate dehydrogenase (decarboxylating)